jgi:cytidylate kinase
MSGRRPRIAIDGPVGAGKSTVARLVAQALGYRYIDSGAMYRALALAAHGEGAVPEQPERILALLESVRICLQPGPAGANLVYVNGREVTEEIRSPEVSQFASQLSEIPAIREHMVALQRQMAQGGGVVMEGRDIQTVVLPDAELKVFLTASPEERARRRYEELRGRGAQTDFDQVLSAIRARDERDSTRRHSPLRAAPDAVHLDTDGLTIEQVVGELLTMLRQRTGGPHGATHDAGSATPPPTAPAP